MKSKDLIIERIFNTPINDVWKAITEKDLMKQWYFDLEEFKPELGFNFQFTASSSPKKQYVHLCEITEVVLNNHHLCPNEKGFYVYDCGSANKICL